MCNLVNNPNLQDFLSYITCIVVESFIPFIFGIAIVVFVWGVVQYVILGAEEEAKRAKGKQFMIWGILALSVMVSVWGIVAIVRDTFEIDNVIPQLQEY